MTLSKFLLLGVAAADAQFFAPAQPAVQLTSGLRGAYPSPMVYDALPQPVLIETAPEPSSSQGFGVLACIPFGVLGYALAQYAKKPAAGNAPAPATSYGELVTAPAAGALLGPIAMAGVGGQKGTAITSGDIGTTKPLGVYDPLELMTKYPEKYRRYQELEIKHGRFAMAAVLHVLVTEAGFRWPGYLSIAEDIKFSDMPGGTIASWAALPNLAWAQIVLIVALLDNSVLKQDPSKEPGDVAGSAGIPWVRYEDKAGTGGKEFKLNAERNNGRAAMMGITGMIIHEALTGNPLFPIEVPEQPVLMDALDDIEKGPARVGSFVLVSLGMAFCGAIASIPEFNKRDAAQMK